MADKRAGANLAFTLLELLAVIALIVVLATLILAVGSNMRARAQREQCAINLRSLYLAAEAYLQQNGSWPQIGAGDDSDSAETDYARAWIDALKPFGATQQTWICPTMQASLGNPDLSRPENIRVDYTAMQFDDKPLTPHQWPKQPWFMETGNEHGNGPLVIFTDGSISDINSVMKEAGAK